MMRVAVEKMRVYAYHGVGEQERQVGNEFEVTAWVKYYWTEKSPHGEARKIVDYGVLAALLKEEMARPEAYLEDVVVRMRERIMWLWPYIITGSVAVAKLTPPIPNTLMERAEVTLFW